MPIGNTYWKDCPSPSPICKTLDAPLIYLNGSYLNGSFVTAKPFPDDCDAVWDTEGVDFTKRPRRYQIGAICSITPDDSKSKYTAAS